MARSKKEILEGVALVTGIVGSLATVAWVISSAKPVSGQPPPTQLTVSQSFADVLHEPDGTSIAEVGIDIYGTGPFSCTFTWSDGVQQTNTGGVFSRTFPAGFSVPSGGTVIVTAANSQTASVNIKIPFP